MDIEKLAVLGGAARYDICASSSSGASKIKNPLLGSPAASGICHSYTPDGRCVSLLKVLMTNECQQDCAYCTNRVQRDVRRTGFSPEELSKVFVELYKRNYVEGLFLSSGIRHSPARSMEEMIKTAEILRSRYRFGGYIHLKILPGSPSHLISEAVKHANRVSLNLEVPNEERLAFVSKTKKYKEDLLSSLNNITRTLPEHPGTTQTTQFVVGAARESDSETLAATSALYIRHRVKRVYFSAFQPIAGTPLETLPPAPLKRENRLYQADFLMRLYDFTLKDLVFDDSGNLDLDLDPKLMFAIKNPQLFPIEINSAGIKQLLRIPGIGPKSARKIVSTRRQFRFSSLEELKNAGVVVKRAAPFLTVNGKRFGDTTWLMNPQPSKFIQLSLW